MKTETAPTTWRPPSPLKSPSAQLRRIRIPMACVEIVITSPTDPRCEAQA